MSTTQTYTGTLTVLQCANCGMTFGITTDFEGRRRDDHESFYCPKGHSQSYRQESEAERLKRQLAETERQRVQWMDRAREKGEEAKRADASRRVVKGHLTRIRKRVAAGVCPCCKRTVSQLAAHMKTKHPDYPRKDAG